MKKILFIFLIVLLFFIGYKISRKDSIVPLAVTSTIDKKKINEIKEIIKSDSKYNDKYAFFIDMKIPSGKNRFFIYDLKNNKIIESLEKKLEFKRIENENQKINLKYKED